MSASDTHGDDDVTGASSPAFDEGVARAARAGHAVGMADGDRTAIDVEKFVGNAQFVPAIDHLHRECFVKFPQADIIHFEGEALE